MAAKTVKKTFEFPSEIYVVNVGNVGHPELHIYCEESGNLADLIDFPDAARYGFDYAGKPEVETTIVLN